MPDQETRVRVYVLGWSAASARWELRLGFGEEPGENVVARATKDEDKDAFESICRDYVRRHSVSALRHLPRRLRIEDQSGHVVEDASYDVDAM